jgi:hypothetical protein
MQIDKEALERLRRENFSRDIDRTMAAAEEATDPLPFDLLVQRARTVPLPALWFDLARSLNIAPKKAADLLERLMGTRAPRGLLARSRTGFFGRLTNEQADSFYMTAWNSCESMGWAQQWCEAWGFLRVSLEDAEDIRARLVPPELRELAKLARASAERGASRAHDGVLEATHNAAIDAMVKREATAPLAGVWFDLAEAFGITPKQAAEMIDRTINTKGPSFDLHGITASGLYARLNAELSAGVYIDVCNAAEEAGWSREWCREQMHFLALATQDLGAMREVVGSTALCPPGKRSITCRISATRGRRHPILALLALQAAAARCSGLTAALLRAVSIPLLLIPRRATTWSTTATTPTTS